VAAARRDDVDATFFEIGTAMAFAHFVSQHVDCAVLEVGLGGRLDATNVVQPDLAVVTRSAPRRGGITRAQVGRWMASSMIGFIDSHMYLFLLFVFD
jgi:hypothetical protein